MFTMGLKNKFDHLTFRLNLNGIKAIVWDIDGTLNQSANSNSNILKAHVAFALRHKQPIYTKRLIIKYFDKSSDWLTTTHELTLRPKEEVLRWVENKFRKNEKTVKNTKVVKLVEDLTKFDQYILTNCSQKTAKKILLGLGFQKKHGFAIYPFKKIFSYDSTNLFKPDIKLLKTIIKHTHFKPSQHLIIGDSEFQDIKPARACGMKVMHVKRLFTLINSLN